MFNLAIHTTETMGLKDFHIVPGTLVMLTLAILATETKEITDFNLIPGTLRV